MGNTIVFDYFYGNEADMFCFYRIPKVLFTDEYFSCLSTDAKVLYGLLLDRMSLSMKNGWFDDQGRAYIHFSIEEIMELLHCGKNKAVKMLQELDTDDGIGLVEKDRQGQGKSTRLYVKNFIIQNNKESERDNREEKKSSEVYFSNFKKFKNQTSRSPESKPLEVLKSGSNNTIHNNTEEIIQTEYPIRSDGAEGYDIRTLVRSNLELDLIISRNSLYEDVILEMYQLIVEVLCCSDSSMRIAGGIYPMEMVRERFMNLRSDHIEYILACLRANTTKVRNIKKYMLAALFNAPSTIGSYYVAEVNHDMIS